MREIMREGIEDMRGEIEIKREKDTENMKEENMRESNPEKRSERNQETDLQSDSHLLNHRLKRLENSNQTPHQNSVPVQERNNKSHH